MSAPRHAVVLAALSLGLVLTAGCQSDPDGVAQPLPPVESTASSPESTDATPSEPSEPTPPAWQRKYSPKEIAAYEAALERFTTYEQRSEPIWRRGKATPAAEELLKQYFTTWQGELGRLELYEDVDVQIHGTPTVLDSRATRIVLSVEGQSVTIRQCVDFEPVATFQRGERTPSVKDKTRRREIVLSRSVGDRPTPWRITSLRLIGGDKKC